MRNGDKVMFLSILACFVSAWYVLAFHVTSSPARPSDLVLWLALSAIALQFLTWAWARFMLPQPPLWIIPAHTARLIAVMLTMATLAVQWGYYDMFDNRQFAMAAASHATVLDAFSHLAFLATFALSLFAFPIAIFQVVQENRI